MNNASDLQPSEEQIRELAMWLKAMPELADLAQRQPGDPERPRLFYAKLRDKPVYPMVHIPVMGRAGTLWVGRIPGAGLLDMTRELDAIMAFGITRIVCLAPLDQSSAYAAAARERLSDGFINLPVADFGTPADDRRFEREVLRTDEALHKEQSVLVHCLAGCGRTGMFVSCLLVRVGAAPQSAIRGFRRLREYGPETPEQVAYVVRFARRLGENSDD
jgi:hypothetical protein